MKHLIEAILMPSGFITLLVLLAALFFFFKRRRVAGYLIAIAGTTYVVLGSGVVAFLLMAHLEYEFAPRQDVETAASLDTMVILTGYARVDEKIPITGHVNSSSGFRLLEAARIFARTRHMTVIISGNDEVPIIMKNLLVELAVPSANIVTDQESNNTYESAVHLRERLSGKQFYLVSLFNLFARGKHRSLRPASGDLRLGDPRICWIDVVSPLGPDLIINSPYVL